MERFLEISGPIGLPVAIAALVAAIITYISAHQVKVGREAIRKLRLALEQDPTPADISQGIKMWPEAAQYPQSHQVSHLRNLASRAEGKRAEAAERAMSVTRLLCALAFVGGALYVASRFIHPG